MADRPRYDHPTVFNFLHDYGCDLRARRVFFHHDMERSSESHEIGTDFVVRNLLHLDKSHGAIELWIQSAGGDTSEMWALYDVVRTCDNPILTVGFGMVASAACLLLAGGTGTRYAMPHASFMWHAGTTGVDNSMHWPDAMSRAEWEKRDAAMWIREMARRTAPRDAKGRQIRTLSGRVSFWEERVRGGGELWMDADQMVSHGVVDEVWSA